jgi:tRNA 2-selenouridine synthase
MPELPQIEDFRRLFLENTPLLDVRAPVEFHKGSVPLAENHPIINDEERHQIGKRYKEMGQDEAMTLAYDLVSGEIKQQRIEAWQRFAAEHPSGVLFCWRGGMRSKLAQQALYEESGILYPRIKGGYKALRHFLLDELQSATEALSYLRIGGRTGVGKTLFLNTLPNSIDLEGMARHRGSAFGPRAIPQPSQVDFENTLAIALLRYRAHTQAPLAIEDESRNIGAVTIPEPLFKKLRQSPLLLLEASREERVEISFKEYVSDTLQEYQHYFGEEEGFARWCDYLLGSIDKIKRRLGGERHAAFRALLERAIAAYQGSGDDALFKELIAELLFNYYDPMYDYQIGKNEDLIALRGDAATLREYLDSLPAGRE